MTTAALIVSRTTLPRVLRSEWIKLLSLRSTRWMLLLSVLVTISITALMSIGLVVAPREAGMDVEALIRENYGPLPALGAMAQAFITAQILIAVFATLLVTADRASGALRAFVAAVPRRGLIVAAKLLLSGASAAIVGIAVGVGAFAIASPAFATIGGGPVRVGPEAVATLLGGALGVLATSVIASGLAMLFRSTAAALGVVLGSLLVLPSIIQLIPVVGPVMAGLLPSAFINGLVAAAVGGDWPGMAWALSGAAAWVLAVSVIASWRFLRRDI